MAGIAKRLGCTWNSNAIIRHGNVIAQTFGPLVLTVVPLNTLRANTSILVGYGTKIGRCAIATRRRWVGPRTNQYILVGVIIIIVVAGVIGKRQTLIGPNDKTRKRYENKRNSYTTHFLHKNPVVSV